MGSADLANRFGVCLHARVAGSWARRDGKAALAGVSPSQSGSLVGVTGFELLTYASLRTCSDLGLPLAD